MRRLMLLRRSLWHYRYAHTAAVMAAMLCAAILTGVLMVGDTVKAGLKRITALRLGRIHYSLLSDQYPFQDSLAARIQQHTGLDTTAVLMTDGMIEKPDGTQRINRIRILGVDDSFFLLANEPTSFTINTPFGPNHFAANESLWQRLGSKPDDLILRLDDPSALSKDLIFTSDKETQITLRIRVDTVVPDAAMGRFGLHADQQSPLNLFVPRSWLSRQLILENKANLLLAAASPKFPSSVEQLNRALQCLIETEDLGLQWTQRPEQATIELQSQRLFIPEAAGDSALTCGQKPIGVFTYFVNSLSCKDHSTPYSLVTAIGDAADDRLFGSLADNEIIISEWLADDLLASAGDTIKMDYYSISETNTLIEKSCSFRIRKIIPMLGLAADSTLMPPFPGLSDVENCRNWNPSIPVDLSLIRDKDEIYWEQYRGTPKAFLSLDAGQRLWKNRFGNLTAVRWSSAENSMETLRRQLSGQLNPSSFGLFFDDLATHGRLAHAGSTDFGGLFAGLSMFLILACCIVLSLISLFIFEQRSPQVGISLAMGWSKLAIYRYYLTEGVVLVLFGSILGTGVGILYTFLMMAALCTVWQDAVAGSVLHFYPNPMTLAIGIGAGFMISTLAMCTGLFKRLKKTPTELLSNTPSGSIGRFSRTGRVIRRVLLALCIVLGLFALRLPEETFFFVSGSLALLFLVLVAMEMMQTTTQLKHPPSSPIRLVIKNIIRRPGRSLAVLVTVACGVFIVLGVGLNRKSPTRYIQRDSGTGGFALWVETAITLAKTPDAAFRNSLQRDAGLSIPVDFVPLRQHRGDDASCLNLNRAQSPTLLGINPEDFARRKAFSFRAVDLENISDTSPWALLTDNIDDNTIPAIGDYSTVYWGLGLNIGKTLEIQDDRGQKFSLKIVGILKESIFQGRLLISERHFIERFPSDDGYKAFLVEADPKDNQSLTAALSRKLADYGAEVVSTKMILQDFLRVENTYLAIFLALGGLGLVLGSAGAGLVLLFNVMDRRGELAMMQAMGFSDASIRRLLLAEHLGLFAAGILAGGCSAFIAVLPSLKNERPGSLIVGLLLPAVIFASGVAWVLLAGRLAIKRNLLDNLRNE